MQTEEKDNLIFVRLFPGEGIYDSLKEVCEKHDVETAVVLSGIGQIGEIELGYFKQKGNYTPQRFENPHELLSLSGSISKQEEKYEFHLHAVLGNKEKRVIGGHLIKGRVTVTGEIVLLKTDLKVKRKLEEETDLQGLLLE